MNKISGSVWKESLRTGIKLIDDEHQELSRLLERLQELPDSHISSEEFADRFNQLYKLWFEHYRTEEAVMRNVQMDKHIEDVHAEAHLKLSEIFVQVNFDCMNNSDLNAADIYSRIRVRLVEEMTIVDSSLREFANRPR